MVSYVFFPLPFWTVPLEARPAPLSEMIGLAPWLSLKDNFVLHYFIAKKVFLTENPRLLGVIQIFTRKIYISK